MPETISQIYKVGFSMTISSTETALKLEHLTYRYGTRLALDDVSLTIEPGTFVGILGPNGSGKSTLYRLISTLMPVQEGGIQIHGQDVMTNQNAVRRMLGVTFQSPSLDPQLTVRENLMTQGQLYGIAGSELKSRIQEYCEKFDLADRLNELGKTLSGGLKRRVEIAKSLLHRPKVLLLDEPTTGLDPHARREFWEGLTTLAREQKMTILLTTHLIDEAEQCDLVALLNQGQLLKAQSPQQLKQSLEGERVVCQAVDLDVVQAYLKEHFQLESRRVGQSLVCHSSQADQVVSALRTQFGTALESVSIQKPTLEDVFLTMTGSEFQDQAD